MNSTISVEDRITASVSRRGRGAVFFGEEFHAMARPAAVRQALSRLARDGTIRRIGVGLYYYPVVNAKLGVEVPPSMDTVARAIAKRSGSKIVPTGAQAANLLGLSTQVPAKPVYLTDASSRNVPLANYSITFRHAGPRRVNARHDISALLFEALRYLGRRNITDQVVSRLQRTLPAEAKAEIRQDVSYASIWVRAVVERIAA